MTNILGINAYHGDASACLVRDGKIVAAAEEERFRRVKHCAGFPSEAIRYCLEEARLSLADVDHVAINSDPKANLLEKIAYALRRRPQVSLVLDRIRNRRSRQSIQAELARMFPARAFKGAIHRVEHHVAHLASAFLVSPFEKAVLVSVDGFGDFSSAAWGVGIGSEIRVGGRVSFPHSLGIFYQAITQYLGFTQYGDEYKVMGLAPYGAPEYMDAMRRVVSLREDGSFALDLAYFLHHKEKVDHEWSGGGPHVGRLYSRALEELLGPARGQDEPLDTRHRDIARSAQAMYEEAFFHLLRKLFDQYRLTDLTLAGGCAMNSVANGKIRRMSPFERVYVQAAAGDAGGALGAAMYVWSMLEGTASVDAPAASAVGAKAGSRRTIMDHAYLGPGYDASAIAASLEKRSDDLLAQGCAVEFVADEGELCRRTATAVAEGKIVGWFQGRMEWGPRALGNRSIVADPRRAETREILNLKIKRRESFRPFAPSILREHVADWFEEDGDVPFMTQVFQIRKEKRALIAAVTHVDGSGRLQTVRRETNARYYRLIAAFYELTGIPMVLNTSFNEHEPIVCEPGEALDCFLRTRMDALVLGNVFIWRSE